MDARLDEVGSVIVFDGRHLPVDLSGLCSTDVARLAMAIGAADDEDSLEDRIDGIEAHERERVVGLIQARLDAPTEASAADAATCAAQACADLVIDNLNSIRAETHEADIRTMLVRWFEGVLKPEFEAVAEAAIETRFDSVRSLLDDLS